MKALILCFNNRSERNWSDKEISVPLICKKSLEVVYKIRLNRSRKYLLTMPKRTSVSKTGSKFVLRMEWGS